MYGNPFNPNLLPPSYPQTYPQNPQFYSQQKMDIPKVNGRNGAEAFTMPANSNVLLLDEHEPIVWLKSTDSAGYPTLTPYSITPYQEKPQTDLSALEERISRLEAAVNDKSHPTEYKQERNNTKPNSGKTAS